MGGIVERGRRVNRRDLDRAVDERVAFYHGSGKPLPVGEVLRARMSKLRSISPVDQLVDAARPADAPPRWRTWYMATDPCDVSALGGSDAYVYRVEPTGTVVPVNYDWYRKVRSDVGHYVQDTGLAPWSDSAWVQSELPIAERYWQNAPSAHAQTEWLVPEIKVVRQVKCKSRVQRGRK